MNYIVLARKYRPQTFNEVYSQDHITQILSNAIKTNRIAHAYLFTGPRGVGKTSMARILAKSLNCVKGPSDNPCGICNNCKEIAASIATDVIEIDGASNTSVDDVRDLQKELMYAPSVSKYKIYIIDEVHMLSKNAFNALLKTLEEPPDNVIFIFATTEPQKVLPTIVSRCQRFDFRRIPVVDIVSNLKKISETEAINIDEESLYLIARKSDGGMRDALSLLDQILSYADGAITIDLVRDVFGELPMKTHFNLLHSVLQHNPNEVLNQYHAIVNEGIDLFEFLNSFLEFMRLLLLLKININPKGVIKEDLDLLTSLSNDMKTDTVLYMISLLIQLKQDLRTSSHPSILIEVVLIKMTKIDEMVDVSTLLANLDKNPGGLLLELPQDNPHISSYNIDKEANSEKINETIEIDYVPPKKVKELTKDHVLDNWPGFISRIKSTRKMLSIYLKKENITSVKSDIIFLDFDSTVQYKLVSEAKDELNTLLSDFFGLPVKLIIRLNETIKSTEKRNPTLQDIQKSNPVLAQLVKMTDALITSDSEVKKK